MTLEEMLDDVFDEQPCEDLKHLDLVEGVGLVGGSGAWYVDTLCPVSDEWSTQLICDSCRIAMLSVAINDKLTLGCCEQDHHKFEVQVRMTSLAKLDNVV